MKRSHFLKRLLQCLLLLYIVVSVNFLLFRVLPGDPVRLLFNDPRMTEEAREILYATFGLDKPFLTQYWLYIGNTLRGHLGTSFVYSMPVGSIVGDRLLNTVVLVGPATILAILLGGLLGVICAWKRATTTDSTILGIVLILWSTPTFWLGLLLIIAFFGILPIAGMAAAGASTLPFFLRLKSNLAHLVLPLSTLTLALTGQYAMIMRSILIDVLTEDYITTARSRGFGEGYILQKHAVPNAMLPMTTIIAINIGLIVGGAIQTETVFSWPGIGRLMYDSIIMRDYPVLQGSFLIVGVCVILANFTADILYTYLDPRVRY